MLFIEEVYAGSNAPTGRYVYGVNADLRVAECHTSLDLSSLFLLSAAQRRRKRRRRRRIWIMVHHLSQVQTERTAAADAVIGDVHNVGAFCAVDVDDRGSLAGPSRCVAPDDDVANGHFLVNGDELVENVKTPGRSVARDLLRRQVLVGVKPMKNADPIGQA